MARTSPYCGTWYPGDRVELEELLSSAFEESARRTGGALLPGSLAFVVPHAGLMYSGTVAAAVYRSLRAQKVRRVIVLGFSHSQYFRGICQPRIDAYATPLGEIPVERVPGPFLDAVPGAIVDHSLEIQLPLIRWAVPGACIVPLYAGDLNAVERAEAAAALASLIGPDSVILASSDLTHYGHAFGYLPFPTDRDTKDRLDDLDHEVIEAAGSLNRMMFLDELNRTGCTLCGRDPIALLLETLGNIAGDEIFQETLDYQTSGEITGDWDQCVSYGALAYSPASSFWLPESDCAALLESAGDAICNWQKTGKRTPSRAAGSPALDRRAGVFVTVYRNGELQGCIGQSAGGAPLAQAVPELALAAALDDPRFAALNQGDRNIQVRISILTPLKRIADPACLIAGEHGGHLRAGDLRGLLLPSVASDRNWGRDQFLSALAHKAGCAGSVYQDSSTCLSVFRTQCFGGAVKMKADAIAG